jgi:hypothetical protein
MLRADLAALERGDPSLEPSIGVTLAANGGKHVTESSELRHLIVFFKVLVGCLGSAGSSASCSERPSDRDQKSHGNKAMTIQ